ncbi:hypothetical protein PIROE2DRAFT_67684 [Piromyces sp. E2]|nr:hypothetical protein PIROE2DRAFT_67684 [Piromyces sp. E2]|eukprot:OUM59445.1 hypothetical protein PIROE2DRAFT_67684 [Piromyces sp. E2]
MVKNENNDFTKEKDNGNNGNADGNNSINSDKNSVPVSGNTQSNSTTTTTTTNNNNNNNNDITIFDRNGTAIGSSNGLAQSQNITSDSQTKIYLSISIIILTFIVNIFF